MLIWLSSVLGIPAGPPELALEDLAAGQPQVRRRVLRWFAGAGQLD